MATNTERGRLDEIMARMSDMSVDVVNKTLAAMIYSQPGVGKTILSVGLAKYICAPGKIVLYIDTKEGWVSLENLPGMTDGVFRFQYKEFRDLAVIANAIRNKTKTKMLDFGTVGAVVLDEFSTAAEMLLNDLYRADVGAEPDDIPTYDIDSKLYKPLGDACRIAIERFQELSGVHLIITAHERETIDHRKVKVIRPDFTPKNNTGIQKLMHVVAHMTSEIKGVGTKTTYAREVQSHPSALVGAKSRIGALPIITDTANFVQIIHDWLDDDTAALLEHEAAGLASDPLPDEGIPVAEDFDDEPALMVED